MSVGKTADAGTISIFTKDSVTVHEEQDIPSHTKGPPFSLEQEINEDATAYH